MRPKHLYLGLCLLGTMLPLAVFVPFVPANGLDPGVFLDQLFGTPVSGFFGWDVIVSSLVVWTFVVLEGRRMTMTRLWLPIAATLIVGVSLGLPLFLYMREVRREANSGLLDGQAPGRRRQT
jgi:Terpene cyclase DEP1